ncbi:choice-of-anchor Q domain-containing protein [Luteimonas suaedae]|uniref:choice-of-anchor Q domain-containing protein n=1 Tax=Luteimonas suaedae TaxID=2605430 RepID=UPI0011EC4ADA|nr:choice-of-anchor Q domain-containing protein [Luteimonas suaedae]
MARAQLHPVIRAAAGGAFLLGVAGLGLVSVPGQAHAATHLPTTCADSGAGSLRATVAGAASGDTVDLRGLSCGRIVLTSGAIMVPQASLAVRGPGFNQFAISGNYASSVFRHTGTGELALRGIAIEHGQHRAPQAEGGCVYTAGDAELVDVHVRHCGAYARNQGFGGGVHVEGDLILSYSAIYSNGVDGASTAGGGAFVRGHLRAHRVRILKNVAGSGGGVRTHNGITLSYATVSGNRARASGGGFVSAALQGGPIRIAHSTISDNSSDRDYGGLTLSGDVDPQIVNTTISGNSAVQFSAGWVGPNTTIANSTIAFNRNTPPFQCLAALAFATEIHLESTIIAGSTCNGEPSWDISDFSGTGRILGANNLIQSTLLEIPADTLCTDPRLLPLAANGGRTQTHALAAGSPAIDAGNNVAGLEVDQRGPGFPRVRGARADIGAFER